MSGTMQVRVIKEVIRNKYKIIVRPTGIPLYTNTYIIIQPSSLGYTHDLAQ